MSMFQHIGITGSRDGMSGGQIEWFVNALASQPITTWLHHGCCVGVDEEAHWLAFELGIGSVGHPPLDTKLQMKFPEDVELAFIDLRFPKEYLERNRVIVDESSQLWAFPNDGVSRGTWYTVNYAVSQKKPVTIVYRDGRVEQR